MITFKKICIWIFVLATVKAAAQTDESLSEVFNFKVNKTKDYSHLYLDDNRGKYYALFICVDKYFDKNITSLDHPIEDGTELAKVLSTSYTFDTANVVFLRNPVRVELIQAFEKLISMLKPIDNLLIYYAGHGYWDKETKQGYWLLADAIQMDRSTWFLNEAMLRFGDRIDARHLLLISDACFSGGIFKTRALKEPMYEPINKLYKFPSSKAMTSGALTTVPDKSLFSELLIRRLNQNQSLYLPAERLYGSLKMDVLSNGKYDQIPQYGEISVDRNKGGDFIFIRRENNASEQ